MRPIALFVVAFLIGQVTLAQGYSVTPTSNINPSYLNSYKLGTAIPNAHILNAFLLQANPVPPKEGKTDTERVRPSLAIWLALIAIIIIVFIRRRKRKQ